MVFEAAMWWSATADVGLIVLSGGLLWQYPVVAIMLAFSMLASKRMITHLRGTALVIQTGNALDVKDVRYVT